MVDKREDSSVATVYVRLVRWAKHTREYRKATYNRRNLPESHELEVVIDKGVRRWLWTDNYTGTKQQWYLFNDGR